MIVFNYNRVYTQSYTLVKNKKQAKKLTKNVHFLKNQDILNRLGYQLIFGSHQFLIS